MKKMLLGLIFLSVTTAIGADDLKERDSATFDYRYEMDVSPLTQDLDGDGFADFVLTGGDSSLLTVSNGKAVLNMENNGVYLNSSAEPGNDGGFWKTYAPTADTGYTIEFRMKTLTMKTASWVTAATVLAVSDEGICDAMLLLSTNNLAWSYNPSVSIGTYMTDDVFHTYRLVRMPNESRFMLWYDGTLVTNMLTDAISNTTSLNRFMFGAIGGAYRGKVSLDYLRFTKGAYAPPSTMSSEYFPFKFEMSTVEEGFYPNGSSSIWSMGIGTEGISSLNNGKLSVEQPAGAQRYWQTVGTMSQESAGIGNVFSFEIRVKIGQAWDVAGGWVLNIVCGAGTRGCMFTLGENGIRWRDGDEEKVVYSDIDNTDRMHVFRVARGHDGCYTLWRDGVLLVDNLPSFSICNYVRIGIVSSSSHGGSFDIDYIRWTTEGMFAPEPPLAGLSVIIR